MTDLWIYPDPLDASCTLVADNNTTMIGEQGISPAGRPGVKFSIPDNVPNGQGATLTITATGKTPIKQRGIPCWGDVCKIPPPGQAVFISDDFRLLDSFPSEPPTRMEVLSVNMGFLGGEVIDSPTYGKMPWCDIYLSICDYPTRQLVYAMKRRKGETHCIVHIPNPGPSGGGSGNFYNNPMFPKPDWTNGMTGLDSRFTDMVYEVIANGFKPVITMDERYEFSIKIIRMVMGKMDSYSIQFSLIMPGYDGVFYGWEPSGKLIPKWATIARSYYPNCYLGLEHQPGRIPLGQGPDDYIPGGLMNGYDCILGEFPSGFPRPTVTTGGNEYWQVLGRMIRGYKRPPEQGDIDPHPPFYLVDSVRGPRTYIAFETWNPYRWVNTDMNNPEKIKSNQHDIEMERQYFRELGCKFIG